MNRSKRTMAVAISQILAVFLQSILALFATRAIIANVGSDLNGLTSTATQVLTFLTLIEGGYTLASLVKLYEPYNNSDHALTSKYISLSSKKFKIIGILYFVIGVAISLAYAPFIKTEASFLQIFIVMSTAVISSAFSVFYVTKFRLLYQVSQTEYVIYFIQAGFYIIMYSMEILLVTIFKDIVIVRLCVAAVQILQGVAIGIDAKRRFKNIKYHEPCDDVEITGTSDVFVSRVSGLIYSAAPVFFISTFVGTVLTSIYAVYTAVVSIISNVINSFLVSPRNALGQMIHSPDKKKLKNVFDEYEFISTFSTCLLSSVTLALIIPFVRLYTSNVADVNYIDPSLAILMLLNVIFQMMHIPSGTCLEVAGHFKAVKFIQGAAAIFIAVASVVGVFVGGIYGILTAKLLTSLLLCVVEIIYVRKKILQSSLLSFCRISMPTLIVSIVLAFAEFYYFFGKPITIFAFVLYGCLLVACNAIILLAVNMILNRKTVFVCAERFFKLIKIKK